MYSLVVNRAYHETSAILIKDDKIISGLEEERTSNHRHSIGEEPRTCIKRLLEEEKITIEDIDELYIDVDDEMRDAGDEFYVRQFLTNHLGSKYMSRIKKLPKLVQSGMTKHHTRHALSSFYTSGFKSACSICIDGQGDLNDSVTLSYIHEDGTIDVIKKFSPEYSLGSLYNSASMLVTGHSSEGKFMGLASFGRPNQEKLLYYTEDGEVVSKIECNSDDKNYVPNFIDAIYKYCYPFNLGGLDTKNIYTDLLYYVDFAASIQECINVSLINLAKYMKKLYPEEDNLVLSGGVMLNCTANGLLDKENIFKNIHCFPAANDAGVAWGSAYYYLKHNKGVSNFPKLHAPYFGPKYDIDGYIKALKRQPFNNFSINTIKNYDQIFDKFKNECVIAWFQDGSECGPRALGHRSLLGDPRTSVGWKYLSIDIKQREVYRPLAPIVLAEHYQEIFEDEHPDNLTEYMLKNVKIKPEWRDKIPAVCHIDGTARPQLLYRETNPELYDLINEFYKRTGIPLMINTSFNNPGYPIIETIDEALNYIMKQEMKNHRMPLIVNNKYIIYADKVSE